MSQHGYICHILCNIEISYLILSHLILSFFYPTLSSPLWSYLILPYFVSAYLIQSSPILSHHILSYRILFSSFLIFFLVFIYIYVQDCFFPFHILMVLWAVPPSNLPADVDFVDYPSGSSIGKHF